MMVRCVVVGCGWAGTHHINTILHSADATLEAIVDVDSDKRAAISAARHIPVFADITELLSSGVDFDAAIVCTLPALHFEQCMQLITAGRHILCEKPVCRDSGLIAELMRAAGQNGTKIGVAFNQRFGDAVIRAKELLSRDGDTVHLVTASMFQQFPTEKNEHVQEDFMLTDACCHLLDVLTFLCGPVRSVRAVSAKIDSGIVSDIVAAFEFENGCIGSMSHTGVGGRLETQHPFQCIDIHTRRFRCRIDNLFDRLEVFPHDSMEKNIYETSVFRRRDYAVSMMRVCEEFIQAIRNGNDVQIGLDVALSNMRVLEAIRRSAEDSNAGIPICSG